MKFKKPIRGVKEVFLHHSATSNPDHDDISWIRHLHVNENGWQDVGYHFFIKSSGEIQKGRDLEFIPAAQSAHNTYTIAICLSGTEDNFTDEQFKSLQDLCSQINKAYKGKVVFRGHKEVNATLCPSYDYRFLLNLREDGYMPYSSWKEKATKLLKGTWWGLKLLKYFK